MVNQWKIRFTNLQAYKNLQHNTKQNYKERDAFLYICVCMYEFTSQKYFKIILRTSTDQL